MEEQTTHKRLGLLGAASLQLINPKSWMMALAVVSVFVGDGTEQQKQVLYLSLIFFLISLPCLSTWALLGVASGRALASARVIVGFNRCMGIVLLGSTWLGALT